MNPHDIYLGGMLGVQFESQKAGHLGPNCGEKGGQILNPLDIVAGGLLNAEPTRQGTEDRLAEGRSCQLRTPDHGLHGLLLWHEGGCW
jgi:hypothetical protein